MKYNQRKRREIDYIAFELRAQSTKFLGILLLLFRGNVVIEEDVAVRVAAMKASKRSETASNSPEA